MNRERPLKKRRRTGSGSDKRILWILGIPNSDKQKRGLQAEEAVLAALEYFKESQIEFPGGKRIKTVTPTKHFSQEDIDGKDIIVNLQAENQSDIEVVPIQVRDWWTPEEKEKYKGKGICLIGIWLFDENKQPKNDQQVKEEARRRTCEALAKWLFGRKNNEIVLSK